MTNLDNFDEHDFISDDEEINDTFLSEPDDLPHSWNIDLSDGSPLCDKDFHVVHYNINSITAECKLD